MILVSFPHLNYPICVLWDHNRRMFEQLPDWQSKLSTRVAVLNGVLFALLLGFQIGRLSPRATHVFEDPSFLVGTVLILVATVAFVSVAINRTGGETVLPNRKSTPPKQ